VEAANIVKPKWIALGEEGQKKYHDLYNNAKIKYEEDMKKWLETEAGQIYNTNKEKAVLKRNRDRCLNKNISSKRIKKDDIKNKEVNENTNTDEKENNSTDNKNVENSTVDDKDIEIGQAE